MKTKSGPWVFQGIILLINNNRNTIVDTTQMILEATRGVQYVIKTAQYIPQFYIYILHNYFHSKVCFLAK